MRIQRFPIVRSGVALVALAILAQDGSPHRALAQEGGEELGPTPIVTVVKPGVVTVVPQQTVVAPIQSTAEARTEDASLGLAEEQAGGNIFTGVRGGFIGAGIGFGAVLALAAAVAAVRRGYIRLRQ